MDERPTRKIATIDFETDPFKHGRMPRAFACGFFDGEIYAYKWGNEANVIRWAVARTKRFDGVVYAHNGGRFDFLGILFKKAGQIIWGEPVHCIAGRIVKMQFGQAELRDSYAILPSPLRAYDKGEMDYAKLESSCRDQHRGEILAYLRRDCISLHSLVSTFVALHGFGPLTAASAGMKYSKKLGIIIPKFNDSKDEKFRKFYYGGLVLARKPGIHEGNFSVYDIKSAYPYAMFHRHSATTDFDFSTSPCDIKPESFVLVEGTGSVFLRRTKEGNEWGGKGQFHVTGWEYLQSQKDKTFRGKILYVETPKECKDFKPYITHFFDEKQKAEASGDKAGRLIAKIMLNSLYGKFAQRPDKFRDYVLMPIHEPTCGSWEEEAVFDDYGFSVWGKPADGGSLYNVSCAASITGFVRAMLMKAIYETNCHYCDTDSIIVNGCRRNNLRCGNSLGDWSLETKGDTLYIAGKKLYALRIIRELCEDEKTAKQKGYQWYEGRGWKVASKGCRLNPGQIMKICQGKSIEYKNDAPSYSLLNTPFFVKRTIKRTAFRDASKQPNERKKQ
jgi:hypothetical protein